MASAPAFTPPCDLAPDAHDQEIHRRYAALARQSHHDVLGVPRDGDGAQVRAAYHQIARRFHPDARPGVPAPLAAEIREIFIRATEAYRALGGEKATVAPSARGARPAAPAAARPAAQPRPLPPRTRPVAGERPGARPATSRPESSRAPSVEDVLLDAKERLVQGDAEGAVSLLHGVGSRATGEDRFRVQRMLARACIQDPGRRRYALKQLASLLEQSPGDAEALALLGMLFHQEGLLSRAETALRRALLAEPTQPDARAALRAVEKERERARVSSAPPEDRRPGLLLRLLGRPLAGGRHD